MESNFSNRDFEQFVKQNADQYRMFPSEKVWRGINNTLHTRRKWYGFWLSFLLLATGGAVTWVMTAYPPGKKQDQGQLENRIAATSPKTTSESVKSKIEGLLPFKRIEVPVNTKLPAVNSTVTEDEMSFVFRGTEQSPLASSKYPPSDFENEYSSIVQTLAPAASYSAETPLTPGLNQELLVSETHKPEVGSGAQTAKVSEVYPMTIESVTNLYKYKKPVKRVSWQLFVTPTVSYRRLSVNKSFDSPTSGVFPFAYLSDVNSVVTHKPDVGVQIGLSARYPIAENLKLRMGIQFNINRYDIKAYQFNGEVATIDLNGGPGNNTISTWTNYRNYSGYKSDWLKNYYFSVSAPVGAEVKLFGNDKTNMGVAGTLQPTYILSDRAYLISTDFKNYAEVPRLIRHLNLNTSFEAFVNYTSGKTKWQVGPQVRYQVLSSFHNKYPVKENLFDFGLKVGVTLNE